MTVWVLVFSLGGWNATITVSNIATEKSCHELAQKYKEKINREYPYYCLSYQGAKL